MNPDGRYKGAIQDNTGTAGKMAIRTTKERTIEDRVKRPHLIGARGHVNGCLHRPTEE